jgi:hypothetical protein
MACWIVEPNAVGGWDTRLASATEPAHRASTWQRAEDSARTLAAPGDEVLVIDDRGRTLHRFVQLAGATAGHEPRPAAPAGPSLRERLETEGQRWDSLLEWVLPIGAAVSTSWVSPGVAEAGGSWVLVALGTLTWTGGMAGATYAIKAYRVSSGMAVVSVVAGSLLAALGVAYVLGVGVLDVDLGLVEGPVYLPVKITIAFIVAAVLTYGWLGTLLSGSIGVWLGRRLAERFPGRQPSAAQPG